VGCASKGSQAESTYWSRAEAPQKLAERLLRITLPPREDIVELYQLAALVYLERAAGSFSEQPDRVDQWIDRSFTIFLHAMHLSAIVPTVDIRLRGAD